MTHSLGLAAPEVGGAAGFHDHGGRGLCGEEARELSARQAAAERHRSGSVRDGELEDGLGQVDRDRRMLLHVGASSPEHSGVKATLALDAARVAGGVHPITCSCRSPGMVCPRSGASGIIVE